jgi:hypothetical protein
VEHTHSSHLELGSRLPHTGPDLFDALKICSNIHPALLQNKTTPDMGMGFDILPNLLMAQYSQFSIVSILAFDLD